MSSQAVSPSPGRGRDLEALRRSLTAAVRRHVPTALVGDLDDLVQVALLRVLDATGSGEGDQPIRSSYLWRAAYSVVVDEIRRRGRRREVPLEGVEVDRMAAAEPDPERAAASRRAGDGIRSCLRVMAPNRRVAVTLHLQGHTVREVAGMLGWSAKRADNLVYRGLADLRRCLSAKGIEP